MKKIVILSCAVVLFASCSRQSNVSPTKTASLNLLVANTKSKILSQTGRISTANGALEVSSFLMSIANVRIEENSGNDVQQGGNSGSNDGNDSPETSSPEGSENSDVMLAGPFTVDAVTGTVSLQKVDVFPGTFKKVDFSMSVQPNLPFNGGSILVKGFFKSGISSIPFTIQSAFSSRIQLPLAGNGITAKDKSSVTITITVDVAQLLGNIDFSGATVTNGEIHVDAIANSGLLKNFETNFVKFMDAAE